MAIIFTSSGGTMAVWNTRTGPQRAAPANAPFGPPIRTAFARLPAFAANGNHAPTGYEGAQTHTGAMDFLKRVAFGG